MRGDPPPKVTRVFNPCWGARQTKDRSSRDDDWSGAMNPLLERGLHVTRRELFGRGAAGIGTAALAGLLARDGLAATSPNNTGLTGGATQTPGGSASSI